MKDDYELPLNRNNHTSKLQVPVNLFPIKVAVPILLAAISMTAIMTCDASWVTQKPLEHHLCSLLFIMGSMSCSMLMNSY